MAQPEAIFVKTDGKQWISIAGEHGNIPQECSTGSEKICISLKLQENFNYISIPFNPISTLKKTQELVILGLIDLFATKTTHSYIWGLIFLDFNSLFQDFKAKGDCEII